MLQISLQLSAFSKHSRNLRLELLQTGSYLETGPLIFLTSRTHFIRAFRPPVQDEEIDFPLRRATVYESFSRRDELGNLQELNSGGVHPANEVQMTHIAAS